MSADLNNDCEPDYSFLVQHGTNRQDISAIRFDFINSPGLGMIQKVETDKAIPKHGIWWPKGWFEVTNTTLIQFTQFEYDKGGKPAGSPLILLGGIYDQFVTSRYDNANSTEYIHLGSNVWMKEFCNGTHTSSAQKLTRHVPISVTGGEFESFYLTGTFQPNANSVTDNAECYINGGKFGDMAGAGQEQLKGDVTWLIDHADITNFYGGGINDQKPITGHIYVEINNSQVGLYCGGPKFGNMQDQKKVTTKAKGSTFGNFYGAGYGGTSYYRHMTKDKTGEKDWDSWVGDYTRKYVSGKGISTEYECEFIPYSGGQSGQADYVGRYYVLYASLSLAKTKNVESTLEDCHITGSFYGGGKLGSVDGNITSTLKNCTVDENVFGAGFSASVEKVNVVPKGALMKANPAYNESVGVFTDGVYPDGEEYTWTHAASVSAGNEFDETNKYIFTTADLTTLGTVTGDATLNIEGTTSVTGSVFGGGEESNVAGNTRVNISGGTIAQNVYGGGNIGSVRGSVAVNMIDGTVQKDVYGGGALADTQTSNWDAASNSGAGGWAIGKTSASATTTVRLTGGTIQGNAYGGGLGEEGKPAYVYGDVLLDLNGTTSSGETGTAIAIDSKGCVVNQVFGCNNVNGTPMGNVLVHVYATQNKNKSQIGNTDGETPVTDAKVIGSYDVKAVYGGGNLAAYKPAGGKNTTNSTNVIIDGCGLTSIQTVYGGGNAASTPATKVTVNGTFEIEELFGGGNGKDAIGKDTQGNDIPNPGANVGFYDYSAVESTYDTKEKRQQDDFVNYYVYGTGKASVNVFGGTIHRVFGGSNTKGNVRQTAVTLLDDVEGCTFCVDEAYGGGKSAPMDAEAKLLMSCIPGLNVAYGGAEAADIQGNVILNITNGKFDRVFGGNNKSGTIRGSITVNIEETGCKPIIIGELYGGGNLAGYSIYGYKEVIEDNKKVWKPRESESDEGTGPIHNYADPQINVKSFTSIGDIYGGGLGESALMVGSPTVNINVANGKFYNNDDAVVAEGTKTPGNYPIPSHAKGKIGAINNVFGGGNAAKVIGNTNVDIGTQSEVYVIKSVAVGDPVTDYFIRNFDGTYSAATGTAVEGTTYYEKKDVIGADIRGNVYGGGNNAEVTGNTNVQIGKKATE